MFNISEFLSAFLGGTLALLGVWLNGKIQKNQKLENDKADEVAFVSSVKCELISLQMLMDKRHSEILKGEVDSKDEFFRFGLIVSGNYLAFFDQNMQNLMRIKRDDIRVELQKCVLLSRSYLDSVSTHTSLMREISILEKAFHEDMSNEIKKIYLDASYRSIRDFDKRLIVQANDLYNTISEIVSKLDCY